MNGRGNFSHDEGHKTMFNISTCECGCGWAVPLATETNSKIGHVKGQPMRFIRGHSKCQRCLGCFPGPVLYLAWNDEETIELRVCETCAREAKRPFYQGSIHIRLIVGRTTNPLRVNGAKTQGENEMEKQNVTYSVKVWVKNHTEEYPLKATTDKAARRERDKLYPNAELWFYRQSDSCHACLD